MRFFNTIYFRCGLTKKQELIKEILINTGYDKIDQNQLYKLNISTLKVLLYNLPHDYIDFGIEAKNLQK